MEPIFQVKVKRYVGRVELISHNNTSQYPQSHQVEFQRAMEEADHKMAANRRGKDQRSKVSREWPVSCQS